MDRRRILMAAAAAVFSWGRMPPRAAAATGVPTGTLQRLTEPGGGDNRASFTPDGHRLLFASERTGKSQLWSMDLEGKNVQQVHRSDANDYGRVAPNAIGTKLGFSSDRGGETAVYVLDLESGAVTPVSDPAFWSFGPTWSSTNVIAYFTKKGGNTLNIWTASPDGGGARQITNQPGESRQPWWAPDGATLAFSANLGEHDYQLYLARADGSELHRITARGDHQQPFWSPDGRRLVVAADLGKGLRIYVLDDGGDNVVPILQPDGENVHPAWSPDGRHIVFTAGTSAGSALYLFTFDT